MSGFRVRPLAEADIAEAFGWYSARSASLGLEFLRAIDQSVAEIVERPLTFPVVYRQVRRTLVRRFPYAVYFCRGRNR